MSRILILSLVGPPDGVSTARLLGGLAAGLNRRGHSVTFLTTSPHYNRDAGAEEKQPISWRLLGLVGRSSFQGVDVVHVAMPRKGRLVWVRILAWLWFHFVGTLVGLTLLRRHDVIVAPSPPLTIGVNAWLLARLWRCPFIYNVQEVYPDIAIQLGALRNRVLIRAARRLELFVYAKAAAVTVISPGISHNLRQKGVPAEKLVEIPNFVDPVDLPSPAAAKAFAEEHSLASRFVVTYAGNIGRAQRVEVLIEAAEAVRDDAEFRFLIVGDGSERSVVEGLVRERKVTNVVLLPYQPHGRMGQIYAVSSVCVVLEGGGTGAMAAPSKAIEILAAGCPIVAVTDGDSSLARLVEATGSGAVVSPGRPEELAATLREMRVKSHAWLARAASGREHIQQAFSRGSVVGAYERLIGRLVRPHEAGPSGSNDGCPSSRQCGPG